MNVNVTKIKKLWVAGALLSGLAAITATAVFSQSPAGGHTVTVIHLPPPHFTDVSGAAVTQSNFLFDQGITSGCGATTFCPNDNLDRSTAAVLIIRAIYSTKNGAGSVNADNFTYTTAPYFTDVPATHPQFKWIQKMKDLAITSGCKAELYCPDDKVQNFEIAIFSARAKQFLDTGLAIPATFTFSPTPYFSDETLTADATHFSFIQREGDLGVFGKPAVSAGCKSGNFCATNFITRGQSLAYVTRGIMGQSF